MALLGLMPLFCFGVARHQVEQRLAGVHAVVDHLHHLSGDGHLHPVLGGKIQDALATLDTFTGLLGQLNGLLDGQAAAQVLPEGPVARQRRCAGGDEVTDARQTLEGQWVGSQRSPQPTHFR